MGKPVGYLLRVELVHCSRGPAWTKQGQIACPTLLLNGSYHPTFRVQELQFSLTTTKRRLQQSMSADEMSLWCFSVVWFAVGWFDFVCDLRLVLATLLRWPLRAGRISCARILILSLAKGDTTDSGTVPSLIYSFILLCLHTDSNTGFFNNAMSSVIVIVLREHRLHILNKNLFLDHYLATCHPQCQLCCFIIWLLVQLLVTSSWRSAQSLSFEVV